MTVEAASETRHDVATVVVVGATSGGSWLEQLNDSPEYRVEHLPEPGPLWRRFGDVSCIVVDIGGGGGDELARQLRPGRLDTDVPVVVIVDEADDRFVRDAAALGVHDVVTTRSIDDGARLRNSIRLAGARRAALAARQASASRLQTAFGHVPAGIAVLDEHGTVLEANDAFGSLVRCDPATLVNRTFAQVLAVATDGDVRFDLTGNAQPVDLPLAAADGSVRWARLQATVARELGAGHIIVSLVDVSDIVELQRRFAESIAENEKRLRYEVAVAECSNVLLRAESNRDLDPALAALREAAEGTSIFVEMNVDHPDLGLCTSLVHEVSEPGVVLDFDFWSMMPWSRLPESYAVLSEGGVYTTNIDDLGDVEREAYVGMDIEAEANAPIFVRGRWAGLVGLADRRRKRDWSDSELRLLRTAAQMIGAFWDKQEVMASLESAVAEAERRIRYEHALFEASRALLITDDETALPAAMEALLGVTEATNSFLERNVDDPGLGLCTEVLHHTTLRPDGTIDHYVHPYWERVPWSQFPDSFLRLSQGEPFAFTLDELGPTERAAYDAAPDPVASEIDIPIFVDGVWAGLIGFADDNTPRSWDDTEVRLLQTAADMIGAYWSRQEAHARMRELVHSKDEFLAAVSHELRTPLTTVVGLSSELRDRPEDFEPAEVQELIGLMAGEAGEMANLVADLLVAARTEVDGLAVDPQPVDLAEEVRGVVKAVHHKKEVEVVVSTARPAWADPLRTRQIIRNLFTNAVRYGGGRIRFEIGEDGEEVHVRACDDGDVIPDGDRALIFKAYHRAHNTPSQPGSVGLGLTVARKLARLMGGDLVYRAGEGNVFEMTLPTTR